MGKAEEYAIDFVVVLAGVLAGLYLARMLKII